MSGVTVTAQILDPQNHCVLREEEHSSKNISNGYLNLVLGDSAAATPTARNPVPVLSLSEVLNNKVTRTSLKCVDQANNITTSSGSYTPSNIDRRILRIRLNVQGEDIVADFNMRAVGFAVNSEMLNSKTDDDFVNINNAKGVTKSNVESVFDRFTKLDAILNGFNNAGTTAGINVTGNASTATTATNVSGTVGIANGGTGATTAAGARTSLGLGSLATLSPTGADGTKFLRDDGTWQAVSGGGGAVSSVAGRTGAVTLSTSDVSGLGSLATKTTSGTANNTTYLRGDGEWTALGGAASLNIGTGAGTVAAGNDSRITNAIQNAGTDNDTNIVSMSAGLDTNKPGTPVVGQMFVATDAQKIYRYNGSAWVAMAQVGGSGTLASVGLSLPNIFSVTGSPLTADGSISATLVSQNQSHVLAAPNGSNGTPAFRQLQVSDLSNAKSAALYDVPVTGDAGTNQVVKGDDSRLTDARSPIDGSVTSSKLASGAVTDAKIDTVSGSKITGTVPVGTLPVAGSGVAGIVSAVAQSFSGLKTFLNGIAVTGNATISGNVTAADLASTGSISAVGEVSAASLKVTGGTPSSGKVLTSDNAGNASWQSPSGGGARGYQAISTNYAVLAGDVGKLLDVTNGSTVTLPDATAVGAGFLVSVKRTGTSDVSIATTSAQTIDGQSSQTLQTQYSGLVLVSTGSGWIIESKYGLNPALVSVNPTSLSGLNATDVADGSCQTVTVTNTGQIATSSLTVTPPAGFTSSGCTNNCSGQTLAGGASCTVGVRSAKSLSLGSVSGGMSIVASTGGSSTVTLAGSILSICTGTTSSPAVGAACTGGAIYLGSLSWGSSSVSSGPTDRYMTTPGGCTDIPSPTGGSGATSYTTSDFTPASCTGTDALTKSWNDGSSNYYDIPNLTNYTTDAGTTYGATNKDNKYGSENAVEIVAITNSGNGGYHAAARYCDKLSYGGYTDWYLPNRYELNLMNTNKASIPGLHASNYYWSSTEYSNNLSWIQRFSDGNQNLGSKNYNGLVRCVRRF